ncbi:MAG TPA: thiamine phosphate synthase [Acidimicrobiales bacterium]|nr:thiamine phosphate synthase [Acidimicrobiales bacterium]
MTFDLSRCSLYLCTPDRPDLAHFVRDCIAGGVDIVQLREKHLEARDLIRRASLLKSVCTDHGIPFIINDRPDLALEVDADGVHVGQDDVPVDLSRRILGNTKIIGLSTHHRGEFVAGLRENVDYLSAGPIVETPTKPGREATGIEYVSYAQRLAEAPSDRSNPLPFFVTGGITPEMIPNIVKAGGTRFVVVRYLTESDDPRRAARQLQEALARALDSEAVSAIHANGEAQAPPHCSL